MSGGGVDYSKWDNIDEDKKAREVKVRAVPEPSRSAPAAHDVSMPAAPSDALREVLTCNMLEHGVAGCWHEGCSKTRKGDGKKLSRCARCEIAFYCCADHQRADWARHKKCCKLFKEAAGDDSTITQTIYDKYVREETAAREFADALRKHRPVAAKPAAAKRASAAAPVAAPAAAPAPAPGVALTASDLLRNFHEAIRVERSELAGLGS